MSSRVQVKRSAVAGKIPATTDLDLGELAVNTYDGKLFLKKSVSGVESVIEIGGSGGGGGGGSISISDTAPGTAAAGDLWWDSTIGQLRIYYSDGTSSQWVDAFNSQGLQGPVGPAGPTGPQGLTGAQGVQGIAGQDGKTLRYGSVAPGAGVGNDGDFYINITNNYIYGPKAAGAWPAGISLVGGGASSGASVEVSDIAPSSPTAGDLWWDSSIGQMFIYYDDGTSQQWVGIANIPGKDGEGVPQGGVTGQFLKKTGNSDYDTTWAFALENTNLSTVEGKFNNTNTSPSGTTRLNYEGALYATRLVGALSPDNIEATGTKSASTFLAGNNQWKLPPGVVGFKETSYVSGSGTFTADPKALFTEVICTGGGGGGGSVDWTSGFAAAGGGGAGGTAITWYTPTEMGATAAYSIGAGGSPGLPSSGGNGGNGVASTFNPVGTGSTLTGGGGLGGAGAGNTTNTVAAVWAGGAGGTASGGDINREGGAGEPGMVLSITAMMGGRGGSSYWGNGGAGGFRTSSGTAAGSTSTSDGDGGGGSVNSSNTSGISGGSGVSGKIFIIEYLGS